MSRAPSQAVATAMRPAPPELEPMTDPGTVSRSIGDMLRDASTEEGVSVRALVPGEHVAYVRILLSLSVRQEPGRRMQRRRKERSPKPRRAFCLNSSPPARPPPGS